MRSRNTVQRNWVTCKYDSRPTRNESKKARAKQQFDVNDARTSVQSPSTFLKMGVNRVNPTLFGNGIIQQRDRRIFEEITMRKPGRNRSIVCFCKRHSGLAMT